MSAGWEFTVLGRVTARCGAHDVELGPRGRRATLAALLLDVGRPVPADVLVDRVWDTRAPARPLASIHAHVSRLRSGLRAAGAGSPLRTEPPGYRLAVDPSAVDAVRFEASLRRARELREQGDPAAAREAVGAGLALWRGEAYADVRAGFTEAEARRLSGLRTTARLLAAEVDLELGRHRAVVDELEELAAAEPLHEPVQAASMLALYRCGRPADALRRYAAVRAATRRELGVEPGRVLGELHQRMLCEDPGLDVPADLPVPAAPVVPAGPRMVGRDRELDRVCAAVRAAWAARAPVVVAVTGEAGIGKTRLLDEAVAGLAAPDVVVAHGRCWEHGGTPVLWPWTHVVRAVTAAAAGPAVCAALDGATGGRAAALHTLVPGLPGTPPPHDRPGPVPLFDALTGLLDAASSGHRVLVVLEDLHWADPASREMLEYLALHVAPGRLAVLASVRTPDDDGTGRGLIGALSRTGRTERVALSGLAPDDVRAYVAQATGTAPDAGTAEALTERTDGNPFFVGELVRLLDGPVTRIPDEVPDGVREVILRRIGRLSDDHREVLRTASVLGRTFDLDLLETVCGSVVDDAVDRATAAGFLVADPARPGRHRFAHALVARSVHDDIGPGRRRRLHARAADALRDRAGDNPLRHADRVLHHLVRAGDERRLDEAVELSLTVADACLDRRNYVGAEAVLADARDVVARLTGPTAERRELAVLTRTTSVYDVHRGPAFSDDRSLRRRALELARRLAPDRELTAALSAHWATAISTPDFAASSAACDELARHADAADDPAMWAVVHLQRGQHEFHQGHFAAAVTELTATLVACERVDARPWAAVLAQPLECAAAFRAGALLMLGRDDEAAADLDVTAELSRTDDPTVSGFLLGSRALAMVLADRPDEAADAAWRCVRTSTRDHLNMVDVANRAMAAWGRERGAPGSGLADLRAVLESVDGRPTLLLRPLLQGLLADVLPRVGDEALSWLDRAVGEAEATGNRLFLPQIHRMRARTRERLGDPSGAAADRERSARLADEQGIADRVRARWAW